MRVVAISVGECAGDCLPAMRWLYVATLVVLIASTAQYVYSASERPPKKG